MGTVILSPQDCLSSIHQRQNYHFSRVRRPKPEISVSQVAMVPLAAAADCARQDDSGGSPPQDGILPTPNLHGQARALSKSRSLSSRTPSIYCTPSTRKTAADLSPHTVKPKLSRSGFAILPTPLAGFPPDHEGDGLSLLKGRLPFKVVQGNGPGNLKADLAHGNGSKKHFDTKHGSHKKTAAANMRIGNVKLVDGPRDEKPSKPVHDGVHSKEKPKKAEARYQKSLEQSPSRKRPNKRHEQQIRIPSITILQRPENKEAAAELFAKFFQTSEVQDVDPVNEQVDCMFKNVDLLETNVTCEILQQGSAEGSSDSDGLDEGRYQTTFARSTDDARSLLDKKFVRGLSVTGASKHAQLPLLASPTVETCNASRGSKNLLLESVIEEVAPWERWAGPSYINSPPPSALPLPRFSGILAKNEFATTHSVDDAASAQASPPPSTLPASFTNLSGEHQLCVNSDTVASATKDLRRILNLNLCRV